ncbi:hypothetical protein LCGC14_1488540 [marine sediment metagenome]|uniref:Ribbon-helix-helix protein CopG domain-containing protein n=1 Tax=marine sediment metagenome TaxID=412755 RepID=A0A0F9M999_9ZZZZ|nr:MAG: hypothetical protein Lokiarch_12770 [Candidatus Lokiarchaeum sp. GC14_75]
MTTKSIKISQNTYEKLVELAGHLQSKQKRKISIEETIKYLLRKRISNFSESWEMSDEEYEELKKKIGEVWKTWQSV